MDGQYFWKRTEETEIDLADLLKRLGRQWMRIALCALAFAALSGGYGWISGRSAREQSVADKAREAELTEDEKQAVEDAVQLDILSG